MLNELVDGGVPEICTSTIVIPKKLNREGLIISVGIDESKVMKPGKVEDPLNLKVIVSVIPAIEYEYD